MKKALKMSFGVIFCLIPSLGWAYQIGDLEVTLRTSLSEAYDDNITFASTNQKNDLITGLNLGLDAKYEGKNRSLALSTDVSHQIFDTYTNFNNTSENISLTYQQEFSKYARLSLKDSFTHSQEPRTFEDEFGRTTGRYSYYRNNVSLEYTRDVTKQLSLIGRFANEIYDPSRSDLSRSILFKLGVEADYAFNSQTIVYAVYEFSRRSFELGRDAVFNIVGAGVRKYFTSQLYADLRTGMNFINSFNNRDYSKPFYQLSLTDELDNNSRLTFSLIKEYTVNAYTEDLFNSWQSSVSFSRQLLQRLSANLSAFYGEGEYTNQGIKDKLRGVGINLAYDLLHNVKLNSGYSYSKTTSNFSSRDYTRNYVSAGLRVDF